jgi:hypothetical protein
MLFISWDYVKIRLLWPITASVANQVIKQTQGKTTAASIVVKRVGIDVKDGILIDWLFPNQVLDTPDMLPFGMTTLW